MGFKDGQSKKDFKRRKYGKPGGRTTAADAAAAGPRRGPFLAGLETAASGGNICFGCRGVGHSRDCRVMKGGARRRARQEDVLQLR